jgi:hypothetical protein
MHQRDQRKLAPGRARIDHHQPHLEQRKVPRPNSPSISLPVLQWCFECNVCCTDCCRHTSIYLASSSKPSGASEATKMVHRVVFWSGFGELLTANAIALPPPAEVVLIALQVSLFDFGSLASKCDRSSTRSHFGCTRSLQASEAASDTGFKGLTRGSPRFWRIGDRSLWRSEHEGHKGRRTRRMWAHRRC